MKIGFLTPEYPYKPSEVSGGIGTSIYHLSKVLVQKGHRVSIILYGQDKDEVIEHEGVTIYKVKNVIIKGLSLYLTQKKIQKLIFTLCYFSYHKKIIKQTES